MIVSSMTIQEIHKEVFEDIKSLKNKLDEFQKDFKKIVLNSNRFPLSKSYQITTKKRKNTFVVDFTSLKRSSWKTPILSFYAIYSRPEGNYAIAPSLDINFSTIYPPHFFKRYRERIVEDKNLSNEEIIKFYFKNGWGFMATKVNEKFESVYHAFENKDDNDKIDFVAVTSQGYCFGQKIGQINIIKTIVNDEMLFEDQKNTFKKLREAFDDANKERYNAII